MTFDDRPDAAKRLEQARLARGFRTARQASSFYGWSYDSYIQHENGTRGLSRSAKKYAQAYNVGEGWLLTGEGKGLVGNNSSLPFKESYPPNARLLGSVDFDHTKRIPVYGHAVGGEDGEFPMNGTKLFDVLCPPRLADIEGAYAVLVSGDSMYPRYMDGEIVYLDPTRRVRRGDFVVAQIMLDEFNIPHAFIKRFVKHDLKELVLEQFNPEQQLRFAHDKVVSVHYIAMSGDVIELI